jgi:hypothetical protein
MRTRWRGSPAFALLRGALHLADLDNRLDRRVVRRMMPPIAVRPIATGSICTCRMRRVNSSRCMAAAPALADPLPLLQLIILMQMIERFDDR